tara:strand:- start:839 stop:1528 length:690 start_codon:yes stop_codon:yes gene_type:complete
VENNFVLVLGSKPGSKLPNINVSKVYSANGAAERALNYFKKFGNKKLTCLCGTMEFFKNFEVRSRIIEANPNLIYFRSGKVKKNFLNKYVNDIEYISFSRNRQVLFQSQFLRYKFFSIIKAEWFHETNFISKFKHFLKILSQGGMLGVSTGLFSIMLAKFENPDKKILVSGIGIKSIGDSFYGTIGTTKRANVDKKIFFDLDKSIINSLSTTDQEMSDYCSIPLIKDTF